MCLHCSRFPLETHKQPQPSAGRSHLAPLISTERILLPKNNFSKCCRVKTSSQAGGWVRRSKEKQAAQPLRYSRQLEYGQRRRAPHPPTTRMRCVGFSTALASASPGGEVGLACWAGGVMSRSPRAGAASLAQRLGRAQRTTGGAGGWGGGSQQASLPPTLCIQGSVVSPGAATSMAPRPWAASHHTVCQLLSS